MPPSPFLRVSPKTAKQDQPSSVACPLTEGRREERVENMCAVPGKLTGSHDGGCGAPGPPEGTAGSAPAFADRKLGAEWESHLARIIQTRRHGSGIWALSPEPWARIAKKSKGSKPSLAGDLRPRRASCGGQPHPAHAPAASPDHHRPPPPHPDLNPAGASDPLCSTLKK